MMGNKKKRKSRDKVNKEEINLLKPLNLANFTLENDPCFGKHHDLKAPECNRCGDSEICSIIVAQGLNTERQEISRETPIKEFHDGPDLKAVRKFIRGKLKKSVSQEAIITKVQNKWDLKTKKIIKIIVKQIEKLNKKK